jgi:hypothetical protein
MAQHALDDLHALSRDRGVQRTLLVLLADRPREPAPATIVVHLAISLLSAALLAVVLRPRQPMRGPPAAQQGIP